MRTCQAHEESAGLGRLEVGTFSPHDGRSDRHCVGSRLDSNFQFEEYPNKRSTSFLNWPFRDGQLISPFHLLSILQVLTSPTSCRARPSLQQHLTASLCSLSWTSKIHTTPTSTTTSEPGFGIMSRKTLRRMHTSGSLQARYPNRFANATASWGLA